MGGKFIELAQRVFHFPSEDGARKFQELALRRQAKHRENVGFLDSIAAKTDELVERGFSVAHGALGPTGDGKQRRGMDFDMFLCCNEREMLRNQVSRNSAQIKTLAAREDRR